MKIAIIGSGISGLMSAWLLRRRHEVTLFEADARLGGHTNTVAVEHGGRSWNVDTGFIVFNEHNYPNFLRLLGELGVAHRASTMSFSVRCEDTGLEWNGNNLRSIFAQKRNLLRPRFWGMLREIGRFNRLATALVEAGDDDEPLWAFLDRHGFGDWFRRYYIVPMTSAIWSMPPAGIRAFPARAMARFMHNHRMLQVQDRPLWRTVQGGSQSYVRAMVGDFRDRIRTGCPVRAIERLDGGVQLRLDGGSERFDQVVVATHSDQALRLLAQPSDAERGILGALPYQANEAVLHTDLSLMPRRRAAWAAWNAHVAAELDERPAAVTYNMNILQGLSAPLQFLVTLGRSEAVDPAPIIRRIPYAHPVHTREGVAARARHGEISGRDGIHYCGAYWGYGFHEDGVVSALRVCEALGVSW